MTTFTRSCTLGLLMAVLGCNTEAGLTGSDKHEIDLEQTSDFDVDVSGEMTDFGFLPLAVGNRWEYELVYSDRDLDQSAFPTQFAVIVDSSRVVDGKSYFRVSNYLLPCASLPNSDGVEASPDVVESPMWVRYAEDTVWVLLDGEDHLLYQFRDSAEPWTLETMNGELFITSKLGMASIGASTVAIGWNTTNFLGVPDVSGRWESAWGEVFERGLGRVRIDAFTQIYGRMVWDLQEVSFSE